MKSNLPPYPRFGECIRALASALDIKKDGSDVDRLAREGDYDWEKLDGVIQSLLVEGTEWIVGAAAKALVTPWLADVRDRYCRLILDVPLDALCREEALPILIDGFFAPNAAQLLITARDLIPGPDLVRMLSADQRPVAVTLAWLDGRIGGTVEKYLYPESTGPDRAERDKVSKWRNGVDLPSGQGIKLFAMRLMDNSRDSSEASAASIWLMLAAALTRFDRMCGEPVRPAILRHLLTGPVDSKVQSRLAELVRQIGNSWPELAEPGRKLWFDLMQTKVKQPGDQERTWREIGLLETQATVRDPEGRTTYHYAWMKARWHVLSGQYEEALPHYEYAFELACYRAGHQIKEIIREASCLAGFLGNKVFLKRLKHVGVVLGLFTKPASEAVVAEWEFEQFAQQLPTLFPAQGRFVECAPEFSKAPAPGFLVFSKETISEFKLDLKNPDRVRAVHSFDGRVRRWPQLSVFAAFGRQDQVKQLLDAGASVDQLDSSGGSALLCALQRSVSTGNLDVLDLLLKVHHQASTMNAATHRKCLTPLMCAIDLGAPDVVQVLLEKGVDPNKHALVDNISPLYEALKKLICRVRPQRMQAKLAEVLIHAPDLATQDTLRRFGVEPTGSFGDNMQLVRSNPDLAMAVVTAEVKKVAHHHSIGSLTRIVELLLKLGAQPNAAHAYPVPGRTPLMLAAEADLVDVFELMIERGGNPHLPDAAGNDCMDIAIEFKSQKVVTYLRRKVR
jgi:hypothetical protein